MLMNYWIITWTTKAYCADTQGARTIGFEFLSFVLQACDEHPDQAMRELMCMCMGWVTHVIGPDVMIVEPGFIWRMFGEDGQHCLTGVTAYDYDKHHSRLA